MTDEAISDDVEKKEPNDDIKCHQNWFSKRHSEIIAFAAIGSLIVTSILALLTYFSLAEVKRQRELTFKQFVLANRPNAELSCKRVRKKYTQGASKFLILRISQSITNIQFDSFNDWFKFVFFILYGEKQ